MTTTAKRNAILRVGIGLHIVNMMDTFAALATDCTDIIVSFSNHALELAVECGGIRLERKATLPCVRVGSGFVDRSPCVVTFPRAKSANFISGVYKKFLSAILTVYSFLTAFPETRARTAVVVRGRTTMGTIFGFIRSCLSNLILFTAVLANPLYWASSPIRTIFTSFTRRTTGIRTKARGIRTIGFNFKLLAAKFTNQFNLRFATFCVWNSTASNSIARLRTIFMRSIGHFLADECLFTSQTNSLYLRHYSSQKETAQPFNFALVEGAPLRMAGGDIKSKSGSYPRRYNYIMGGVI